MYGINLFIIAKCILKGIATFIWFLFLQPAKIINYPNAMIVFLIISFMLLTTPTAYPLPFLINRFFY